jgi:hypothetical protein
MEYLFLGIVYLILGPGCLWHKVLSQLYEDNLTPFSEQC